MAKASVIGRAGGNMRGEVEVSHDVEGAIHKVPYLTLPYLMYSDTYTAVVT